MVRSEKSLKIRCRAPTSSILIFKIMRIIVVLKWGPSMVPQENLCIINTVINTVRGPWENFKIRSFSVLSKTVLEVPGAGAPAHTMTFENLQWIKLLDYLQFPFFIWKFQNTNFNFDQSQSHSNTVFGVHPSWWESWWNFFHKVRKTLGEIERLFGKSKSSWWSCESLGKIEFHQDKNYSRNMMYFICNSLFIFGLSGI